MDAKDPAMRDGSQLSSFSDELAAETSSLEKQIAQKKPVITPEKIKRVTNLLHEKLFNRASDLRRPYARLLMEEVEVTKQQIRIRGSKAVLAGAVFLHVQFCCS